MAASNSSVGPAEGIPAYVIVDSQDPDRIVPFWCALLGVEVRQYRDEGHIVALEPSSSLPGSMTLVFQRVPEAKIGKNRVHVDMYVGDLDEGAARVEESLEGDGPSQERRWMTATRIGGLWLTPRATSSVSASHRVVRPAPTTHRQVPNYSWTTRLPR